LHTANKFCLTCGEFLSTAQFGRKKANLDGFRSVCQICRRLSKMTADDQLRTHQWADREAAFHAAVAQKRRTP
jgi:hypothetical protein